MYIVQCAQYNRNSSRLGHLFENLRRLNPFQVLTRQRNMIAQVLLLLSGRRVDSEIDIAGTFYCWDGVGTQISCWLFKAGKGK